MPVLFVFLGLPLGGSSWEIRLWLRLDDVNPVVKYAELDSPYALDPGPKFGYQADPWS